MRSAIPNLLLVSSPPINFPVKIRALTVMMEAYPTFPPHWDSADSKKSFSRRKFVWLFSLSLLALVVAIAQSDLNSPQIANLQNVNLERILAQTLLYPLIISIILERSLEVFVKVFRSPGKEEISVKIQKIERDIKALEKSDFSPEKGEEIEFKKADLCELLFERIEYNSQTRNFTLSIAMIFGVFLSISGVQILEFLGRGLGGIVTENLSGLQRVIFRAIDILLSAGLIAGGSQSFHQLMTVYNNVMDTASHNVEQSKGKKEF